MEAPGALKSQEGWAELPTPAIRGGTGAAGGPGLCEGKEKPLHQLPTAA